MGLKRKQTTMRQKDYFEHKLQARMSFLSGKGVASPKADKDTIVRKLQANIRAMNNRLRLIADNARARSRRRPRKGARERRPRRT
jgi:hypothetical protein